MLNETLKVLRHPTPSHRLFVLVRTIVGGPGQTLFEALFISQLGSQGLM